MSELKHKVEVKLGSERGFAVVFAIFFAIVGSWPLISGSTPRFWAFLIALVFLAIGFISPHWLKLPNLWWHKFGLILGMIVAPLVMSLIFVTTMLPIGLLLRLSGKDLLRQQLDPDASSYWIVREDKPQSMNRQF